MTFHITLIEAYINIYFFLFTEAKKLAEEQMNKAKQLAGEKCAIQ